MHTFGEREKKSLKTNYSFAFCEIKISLQLFALNRIRSMWVRACLRLWLSNRFTELFTFKMKMVCRKLESNASMITLRIFDRFDFQLVRNPWQGKAWQGNANHMQYHMPAFTYALHRCDTRIVWRCWRRGIDGMRDKWDGANENEKIAFPFFWLPPLQLLLQLYRFSYCCYCSHSTRFSRWTNEVSERKISQYVFVFAILLVVSMPLTWFRSHCIVAIFTFACEWRSL